MVITIVAYQRDIQYPDSSDSWELFRGSDKLVHYFPDQHAQYYALGVLVKDGPNKRIVVETDSNALSESIYASVTVYNLKNREPVKITNLHDDRVSPIVEFDLGPGHYIFIVRYYSFALNFNVSSPKWRSDKNEIGFRRVTAQPTWKITLKGFFLKSWIQLKQAITSQPQQIIIQGGSFGAYGNPSATYCVGVFGAQWTEMDIKKLYQRSMMGATYRSMSIYRINGTLIKELTEEDLVTSTLEGYCGKLFVIRKIQ